jgi:hypothetical protein
VGDLQRHPTQFPDGSYVLRYKQGKRLVFETVGSDLPVAQAQLRKKLNRLEAKVPGNAVEEAPAPAARVSLASAVETYMCRAIRRLA